MNHRDPTVGQVLFHALAQLLRPQRGRIDHELGVIASRHQRRMQIAGALDRVIEVLVRGHVRLIAVIGADQGKAGHPDAQRPQLTRSPSRILFQVPTPLSDNQHNSDYYPPRPSIPRSPKIVRDTALEPWSWFTNSDTEGSTALLS
jgi:hypothetical protein